MKNTPFSGTSFTPRGQPAHEKPTRLTTTGSAPPPAKTVYTEHFVKSVGNYVPQFSKETGFEDKDL